MSNIWRLQPRRSCGSVSGYGAHLSSAPYLLIYYEYKIDHASIVRHTFTLYFTEHFSYLLNFQKDPYLNSPVLLPALPFRQITSPSSLICFQSVKLPVRFQAFRSPNLLIFNKISWERLSSLPILLSRKLLLFPLHSGHRRSIFSFVPVHSKPRSTLL